MTNVLRTARMMAYDKGFKDGFLDGFLEGFKEGFQEGIHLQAVETARKMKARKMDVRLIAELTELSEKEIRNL